MLFSRVLYAFFVVGILASPIPKTSTLVVTTDPTLDETMNIVVNMKNSNSKRRKKSEST